MSLPWFAFNIKDFLANTKRLNTEAKGAYLCLMLDYYEQGHGAPDDDDVLATICELTVEAWQRHRKVIAPMFEIKDGIWTHGRIDKELLEASLKLATSKARAKAGAAAMHANSGHKPAPSQLQASSKPALSRLQLQASSKHASSQLAVVPEHGLAVAHLHLPSKDSLSTARETPEEMKQSAEVGTPIDPGFWPCENHLAACKFDGATDEIIKAEVAGFVHACQERAAFSANWDASWALRWKRWKEHRDKQPKEKPKAPPRVVVNKELDWESFCKRYAGGMGWPKGIGPDPESAACQCPLDILRKHGFRPVPAEATS